MKVLVIEDEEKLADAIKKGLKKSGYTVDCILDGEAGQRRLELHHVDYDIVILDLMLPKKNGFEVCKNIRDKDITIPILILTARDAIDDKVLALDSGADDYLVKPFSFEELTARLRALLRRPAESVSAKINMDDLTLDPATREVYRGDERINLTLKEFELLHFLARRAGQVVSREDIFAHLWDFADNSLSNVVDVHIKNLRKKIDGDSFNKKLLETVRGLGYRIRV